MKAKAKPKAAAKVAARRARRHGALQRPAGALGGGLRLSADTKMAMGQEVQFKDVTLEELGQPGRLVVAEGYFHKEAKIAGVVRGVKLEPPHTYIDLECTGATNDQLLRQLSGQEKKVLRVLRCPSGCHHEVVSEDIVHAVRGRRGKELDQEDGWMGNLIEAVPPAGQDELGTLRERDARLAAGPAPAVPRPEEEKSDKESSKKKKKKKKRAKEKKEEGEVGQKRGCVVLDGTRAKQACSKEPSAVFGGTGLDPEEKVRRRRVNRRAQRFMAKKGRSRKSSSSSGSSSSSSEVSLAVDVDQDETIFAQASKVRQAYEGFPGALANTALAQMRRALPQELGEEDLTGQLRPVALLYYKRSIWPEEPRAQRPESYIRSQQ